jgi:hypothetical protein
MLLERGRDSTTAGGTTPYLSVSGIPFCMNDSLFAILSMSGREERKTKSLGMTALRTSNGTMNKPKDQHDQYMLS